MPDENISSSNFKSGFIAIAGPPNAGKSTLLNRLLGEKISITSKKPQTTRNRILGVLHRHTSQLVFFDTPGVFEAEDKMNVRIVDAAFSAVGDADLILVVVDAAKPDSNAERYLVKRLQSQNFTAILALNKIDLVEKNRLLPLIEQWRKRHPFQSIVPISAEEGTQLENLIEAMEEALPPGPPYYPEDTLTDAPVRFIAAELIREKVFRFTGEEIPYATAVTIETFGKKEQDRVTTIEATIHLERQSQKGIVIGKNGRMLKRIGTEARKAIEAMLGTKVYLKLFVSVQKNWRKDARALRRFGY